MTAAELLEWLATLPAEQLGLMVIVGDCCPRPLSDMVVSSGAIELT